MIYFDCETVGLHGMAVLIQWAEDDGPTHLHEVWRSPIWETLSLIEMICEKEVCGFNLAFDWFHLTKLYTIFSLVEDKNQYPEDIIEEIALLEPQGRFSPFCLKPKSAVDIMIHARRGPYQSLMSREPIRIRRVPTAMAWILADELEKRIKFDDIYFSKSKDKRHWKIFDIKRPDGTINPDFKDLKLRFSASSALKSLYAHAFKEKVTRFSEIEVDKRYWPAEIGYAPYAMALAHDPKNGDWFTKNQGKGNPARPTWPMVIREHILHWMSNLPAREYAEKDVHYTRRLYVEHFGSPPPGDTDSILTCMVASCRWRGFAIDREKILKLKADAQALIGKIPQSPRFVKRYLSVVMDKTEQMILEGGTKKIILEKIVEKFKIDDNGNPHQAGIRAQEVLDSRKAKKKIELLDKLLLANRFHASFKITGALSNRMSGDNDLNAQGIDHTRQVRSAFPLADHEPQTLVNQFGVSEFIANELVTDLSIGDFKSFEVSLAAKVFNDPDLDRALNSGKKVHAIMGMKLFPGKTYEEICASEATDNDMYDKGKKGFFLKIYFGEAFTFNSKLGIPMDVAEAADRAFNKEFPNVKKFQDSIKSDFGSLSQPGGIGTAIYWKDPAEYSESFLGFRRYFTLENRVTKTLFEIAQKPPEIFRQMKNIKVVRRERIQTAGGATQSALFGACFGIMSACIRAAGNHKIQSPGAEITKMVQREIWELQPCGVHKFVVTLFNVHDEVAVCHKKELGPKIKEIVESKVKSLRSLVPLLAIDWNVGVPNWADKKVKVKDESKNSSVAV